MTIAHPTSISLPHALDRFIERCAPIIRNRDRDACLRFLTNLMSRMTYRHGTWDRGALAGGGSGMFEVEYEGYVVVGTVDGAGVLRTINACEEP